MTPQIRQAGLASEQPPWSRAEPPLAHDQHPAALAPMLRDQTQSAHPSHQARRENAGLLHALGAVYVLVAACFVVFLAMVMYSPRDVRPGAALAGAAMIVAGLARAVLPTRLAGMLATRRRYMDAATLAVLGMGILVVGLVLPPP